jgi:hypothetical protein
VILRGLIPVLLADDLYGGCLAHFGPAVQARYRSASRPDRSHDRPYGWAYYVMLRATRDDLRMFHGPGRSVDITCRQARDAFEFQTLIRAMRLVFFWTHLLLCLFLKDPGLILCTFSNPGVHIKLKMPTDRQTHCAMAEEQSRKKRGADNQLTQDNWQDEDATGSDDAEVQPVLQREHDAAVLRHDHSRVRSRPEEAPCPRFE